MAFWIDVDSRFSSTLRALLDARIDSFEKLELVMALRRSEAQRSRISDLAQALDVPGDELRRAALELRNAGLVRIGDDEVTLAPRTADDQGALDELAAVYDGDKMALVKAIGESALVRLRNLARRAFADAFVIGKRSGGDDDR